MSWVSIMHQTQAWFRAAMWKKQKTRKWMICRTTCSTELSCNDQLHLKTLNWANAFNSLPSACCVSHTMLRTADWNAFHLFPRFSVCCWAKSHFRRRQVEAKMSSKYSLVIVISLVFPHKYTMPNCRFGRRHNCSCFIETQTIQHTICFLVNTFSELSHWIQNRSN